MDGRVFNIDPSDQSGFCIPQNTLGTVSIMYILVTSEGMVKTCAPRTFSKYVAALKLELGFEHWNV